MNEKHTNHLIKETSPYLLQHAHNPVDWYPWGEEALEKARSADKPILVSIGYSACHWCHVMERESFEDEDTAALMNEHFINIKIDREERPDLDHIYMDAVQAMTGSGGWPLNVFLTPKLKPFFGGTYFPPARAFNRSSWKEVITAVASAYKNKKSEIEEQAETLLKHLAEANNLQNGGGIIELASERPSLQTIADNLLKTADKEWGGFGNPPKFPHTFSILYLLRHYHFSGHKPSLDHALLSLDKLMMGGIYDQLGGGFARYATDRRWQIPHFEKMLYDNALLLEAFTEGYQLTKKKQYADVIHDTIGFLQREMMSPEGGFYSALDADSEGVEGKYYTWDINEVKTLLDDDSEVFCEVFDVSDSGNWEQTNILWMPQSLQKLSDVQSGERATRLKESKEKLFAARQKRVRPGLDDKVILCWNALMIKSLCKAYGATGELQYRQLAEVNISFLETNLQKSDSPVFSHSWNKKTSSQEAFIDDYAALVQAYLFLQEVTGTSDYLLKAKAIAEKVIDDFGDNDTVLFNFTKKTQTDNIIKKREIYDGATPSGNAVMADNLLKLSLLFDVPAWRNRALEMVGGMRDMAVKYPASFGFWCLDLQALVVGIEEIAILGKNYNQITVDILAEYAPLKLLQSAANQTDEWPLLRGKPVNERKTMIFVCENYQCQQPVETLDQFRNIISRKHF